MGMFLQGADIHDFLSCLGRHAITTATFGFHDPKYVEPKDHKIVFVEDTDELGQSVHGFGVAHKEETEATPGTWGADSLQKEGSSGWGLDSNNQETEATLGGWGVDGTQEGGNFGMGMESNNQEAEATFAGWGADDKKQEDNSRWGTESKKEDTIAPAAITGRGMKIDNTDRDDQTASNIGWAMETYNGEREETMASSAGWAASENPPLKKDGWSGDPVAGNDDSGWISIGMSESDGSVPASHDGAWGTCPVAADHRDPMIRNKATDDRRASMGGQNLTEEASKEGLQTRRNNMDTCTDERRSGKFGPSGSNMVPLGKRKYGRNPGLSQNAPERRVLQNTQLPQGKQGEIGWGLSKESATVDDNGWGSNHFKEKRGINRDFEENEPGTHEWAAGAELGQVPASQTTQNLVFKNTQLLQGKEKEIGWGLSQEPATVDDNGWSNNLEEEKRFNSNAEKKELGRDEWVTGADLGQVIASKTSQSSKHEEDGKSDWITKEDFAGWGADAKEPSKADNEGASDAGWGQLLASQAEGEMKNESIKKGDWGPQPDSEMASTHADDWGSNTQKVKDGRHGWGAVKSDAQSAPAGNKVTSPFQTSWISGSRVPDGAPPPRKRFNRVSADGSWAALGSNSPQTQRRRPHIRALLNLPEYSELDELYRATNKILHHSDYQPGDRLKPEDEKFILENIFAHHPDKEAKLGCGVDHVMIDSHAEHQVSCFWVVRKDGSKTDFSYWKCLEGLLETKYSNGNPKDSGKEESNGSQKIAVSAIAPSKIVIEAQDGWAARPSIVAPTTSKYEQEEIKGGWKTCLTPSMSDQGGCDIVTAIECTTKTASGQQEEEMTTPNELQGQQKGGWDMWAMSTDPATDVCHHQEMRNSSWEM